MSNLKWTPGPWRAHRSMISKWTDRVIGPNQESIASVEIYQSGYPDRETADANAHLLAAAPDLYNALHQSQEVLRFTLHHPADLIDYRIKQNELALAKARGESQ